MEVAGEVEGLLEVRFDGLELQLAGCQALLGGFEFVGDAVLLGLEEVECDGSGVVGFEQLAALVEQASLAGYEAPSVDDLGLAEGVDLLEDRLLGLESDVLRELNIGVLVLDRGLDVFDLDGALRAAGRVSLAADADEVGVDLSRAALGVADDQAAATAAAPDRALEVVVVDAALLAGEVLRFQEPLNLIEGCVVDQGLVPARIADAAVLDHANVVGASIAQLTVGLKVNRQRQPLVIVSATFQPMDKPDNPSINIYGHLCGRPLPGNIKGSTVDLTAPHPGAYALQATLVVRSAKKIGGKIRTATLPPRIITLGGDSYECASSVSPPSGKSVCDYGYPGNPSGNGKVDCGTPVPNAPFFRTKPGLVPGSSVVQMGRLGYSDGYCWIDNQGADGQMLWLGGVVTETARYSCSGGLFVILSGVWVYLYPDGQPQCNAGPEIFPFKGRFKSFTLPADLPFGGRMAVSWLIGLYRESLIPNGQLPAFLGSEWGAASINLPGTANGCSQILTPPAG